MLYGLVVFFSVLTSLRGVNMKKNVETVNRSLRNFKIEEIRKTRERAAWLMLRLWLLPVETKCCDLTLKLQQ